MLSAALQSDGTIIGAGYANHSSGDTNTCIVRIDQRGIYDKSFFQTGVLRADFGGGEKDRVNSVTVGLYGKIVTAGFVKKKMYSRYTGRYDLRVSVPLAVRFTSSGDMDATFRSTP